MIILGGGGAMPRCRAIPDNVAERKGGGWKQTKKQKMYG